MAYGPPTSVSLIRTLSEDPRSVRWAELYSRYSEPMKAFLARNYPTLDPDDLIQETMVALAKRLPDYRYVPDSKGHFRNYLTGILKHKAMDALAKRKREADALEDYGSRPREAQDDDLRAEALEVAIAQLLADETVNPLHRTVFRHVALMRERPEDVAERFGISRDNVDQIKRRLVSRLSGMLKSLLAEAGV